MQNEITDVCDLLDSSGELLLEGYSKKPYLIYDRTKIKAAFWKIKEWDYYLVQNQECAVALTVADNSYMSMGSVSLIKFDEEWFNTSSSLSACSFGKLHMPASSSQGDIRYNEKKLRIEFLHDEKGRRLICEMPDFLNGKKFNCDILLEDEPDESMLITVPFRKNIHMFYYNQKINCLRATGTATFDGREYHFAKDTSFGVMDWGRGVWPYRSSWQWASASGTIDGKTFGFNIGGGFGDTSGATENMLFFDGKAHKLDQVTFYMPHVNNKPSYMNPWSFSSNDDRFQMNFIPVLERKDYAGFGPLRSEQHQIFGNFTGRAVLDSGRTLEIKDFPGFAEHVINRW